VQAAVFQPLPIWAPYDIDCLVAHRCSPHSHFCVCTHITESMAAATRSSSCLCGAAKNETPDGFCKRAVAGMRGMGFRVLFAWPQESRNRSPPGFELL